MALDFYYGSGSPFAWRVWLALEHKGIPYTFKLLSFDAGDHEKPAYTVVNPRHKVPAIVDGGFALYESAAIVEYLEEKKTGGARLFSADLRERATQRRLIREADSYFAPPMETMLEAVMEKKSPTEIAAAVHKMRAELVHWEAALDSDHLVGGLSAADFTLYPLVALIERIGQRNPVAMPADLLPPRVATWAARMRELPIVQKTLPPHWK
ncbi:MAG: glutathione S-transferase family protein [Proteobacteria bacterium]|nr:glutathione S-transferase family protein [Pseudomonadota bacterium]